MKTSCMSMIGWLLGRACAVGGVAAVLGLFGGCSAREATDGSVGVRHDSIYRGAPATQPDLQGVGKLILADAECSAVLISDRVVLTAAHCVFPLGTGCPGLHLPTEGSVVQFPGSDGNPTSAQTQKIDVLGFAVHPNAYGDRIASCPNPQPLLTQCPQPIGGAQSSCNLVEVCGREVARRGWRSDHDLAIGYLAWKPRGIEPVPVIVSRSSAPPALGLHTSFFRYPDLYDFLTPPGHDPDTNPLGPIVTVAGYGLGSTQWGSPPEFGREAGTTRVKHRILYTSDGYLSCNSASFHSDKDYVVVEPADPSHAFISFGDSGGPVLIGEGDGATVAMTQPTALPGGTGLGNVRYVVGVASFMLGGGPAPGTACQGQQCAPGEICYVVSSSGAGQCAKTCNQTSNCTATYADSVCVIEAQAPTGACIRQGTGVYAPTYTEENGEWLQRAINDIDGDNILNTRDNCPGLPNGGVFFGQSNCNVVAEMDRQGEELGDACDPVPCPGAHPKVSGSTLVTVRPGPVQGVDIYVDYLQQDTIEFNLIGSHNRYGGAVMPQSSVLTEFRFCQEDPSNDRHCTVDESQAQDWRFDEVDDENALWRKVTLTELGSKGQTADYDYPPQVQPSDLTWNYWADCDDWRLDTWFDCRDEIDPNGLPQPSGLSGMFGIRAGGQRSASLLGTANPGLSGNGIHFTPDMNDGYNTGEGLGRHYFPMTPDYRTTTHKKNGASLLCHLGACRPLPIEFPSSWEHYKQAVINPKWFWEDKPDKIVLVRSGRELGYVDMNGDMVLSQGMIDRSLDVAWSDPSLLYVPAAESHLAQGGVYQNVHGIFIASDGTNIFDSLLFKPNGLELQGRIPDPSLGYGPVSRSLMGVTPRQAFVPVFSRILGAVFLVGGRDPRTTLNTGEIWMIADNAAPALLAVNSYQPETVLAATIGSQDQMLWILDEVYEPGLGLFARLVRISLWSLEHEVVWDGRRPGYNNKHWLTTSHDGRVLLTASSDMREDYTTVGFDADPYVLGTAVPTVYHRGRQPILTAPVVDSEGFLFLPMSRQGQIYPVRVPALVPTTQGYIWLAGCM